MAEISSFFNSVEHDRRYFAEDFARHLKKYFTNGIFNNELAVVANNDMSITIRTGDANIEGYRYTNTTDLKKGIEVADGTLKRIDNVVIRLDLTNRLISAQIIKGTYSDTPSAPALVRTTTIYDIKLAEITVNNSITSITQSAIKDTRPDTNLCGIVASTVKTLDITDVYNQLYTKYNELIEEHNNNWETWYKSLKNSIDTWFEGVQQQYKNKLDGFETDFDTWFSNIKGKLSEDIAGSLQIQIDDRYTKEETKQLLKEINTLKPKVVTELPTEEISPTIIYLISCANAEKSGLITVSNNQALINEDKILQINGEIKNKEQKLIISPITNLKVTNNIATVALPVEDYYLACLYVSEQWIVIGTTKTDLSEYAKTTDLPTKLSQLENDLLLKAESEEELITLSQQNPDKFVYTVQEES